jgi:hypothetical protein
MFQAARALPLDAGLGHPRRVARLVAAAWKHPGRFRALAFLVLRTEREYPRLSASAAGHAIGEYPNERRFGLLPQNRLCRGVLVLPDSHERYLRGRRRQALRTNLQRASAAKISCGVVDDVGDALGVTAHILQQRGAEPLSNARITQLTRSWSSIFAGPGTTVMVARDIDGHPGAIMAMLIDESICLIRVAVASSHEARWALHDHLVATLIDRRVTYLLADGQGPFGALGYDADLQHYQHLLGYELRHLIPRTHAISLRTAVT